MATDWKEAKRLFGAALKLAPAERLQFLDQACAGDNDLRREVESLLSSYNDADSFLENSPIENAEEFNETKQLQIANGASFGHYQIIKQIGAGGMGEVYLAKDTKLDRQVAVKILNEKFAAHESNLQRFVQEAKAASALNHPNILVIHEIGASENAHYMVSEYIEGETLREIIKEKTLQLSEVLEISIQIANALVAAHSARIVHRDIKPENVMIRPDGFVKILDFGLAKLVEQKAIGFEETTIKQNQTAKGIILGTVNYMSPEQAKGEKVDERTDIFSFGVILYEMIAGRTPFAGETVSETFANLINREPLPLARFAADVPDELNRIVSKTLRKNRDERYQTMKGLLADLKDSRQKSAIVKQSEKLQNTTAILQSETKETSSTTDKNVTSLFKRHQSITLVAAGVLLLAATIFGYYFFFAGTSSNVKKSLAVLPFVNASQDPNAEYLSDGIADSVINRLSQVSNLRVMSRNSAFRFKGNQTETKNIAAQLGVENLVLGDIKQVGDKFVINVRLIDAKDDSQIWGNQYVKTSGDIIAAQNEIAQAVADNLRVKLSESEQKRLGKNYTDNPEAYQLYLKGRFHLSKVTRTGNLTAISYFKQAIAIEPNYALAYAGLADTYRALALAGELPPREMMPQAKAAASKALEIDDSLSEAHASLGFSLHLYNWDWNAAENQFKRAIELDPNNGEAHIIYADMLSGLTRYSEALAEARRGAELDPLNLRLTSLEARFLTFAGKPDEALARLDKVLELDPNFWFALQFRASALIEKRMYEEAVTAARKSLENNFNTRTVSFLCIALAKSGKTAEARAELDKLLKLSQTQYVPSHNVALIYNGLGERDEAIRWLERAIEERDPRMPSLKAEQKWNNLRDDPRFQEILRRVGLESTSPNTSSKVYWQMSDAEQLAFIRQRAQHTQTLIGDEPNSFDEEALRAIKDEIDDYADRKDSLSQKKFEEGLRVIYGRASQYAPIVVRAYESRKIPAALGIYQAMIESEYNDCYISSIGSVGLFQFKPSTATKYSLTRKDFCNVEKQSVAAAAYMSDLISDFGEGKSSWTLALLSFNQGENATREQLRELRGRNISERSFWAIFRWQKDLKETLLEDSQFYVPRFFAAAIIGETPEAFELSTPPLTTLRYVSK